jgi:hypothetical protein
MSGKQTAEKNLQKLLQQAYRAGVSGTVPEVGPQALMRRIRHPSARPEETSADAFLDRLFWRLAPAAGALIAILAMVMLNLDFIPDTDVWSLLSYESEAAAMAQILLL